MKYLIILLLCTAARANVFEEPPKVDSLSGWVAGDSEMVWVGFVWKTEGLIPTIKDFKHTQGEVLALIDYYKYPQVHDIDSMWASTDGEIPESNVAVSDEGRGFTGFLSDHKGKIAFGALTAGVFIFDDELQDAWDGLVGKEDDSESDKKEALGTDGQPIDNARITVTANEFTASSATNLDSVTVTRGESGSGTTTVVFQGGE